MDPRERFSGAAERYARFRPGYPDALVDWVLTTAGVRPGGRVADVGCGTGICTRMLASRGLDVVGLDPNEDMLAEARAAGGAEYRRGEATATGLPDASVDLVTVAQAFHWFDLDPALEEFARILRPEGHVAALYNLRGESPFLADYDAVLRRFSPEYGTIDRWEAALDRLRRHPRVVGLREREVPNAQVFDFEGLRGRAWSSSYVFSGVTDRDGFDAALRAAFERHVRGGTVDFPYRSVALVFGVAAGGRASAVS
jgi:ubiquinone/menaquinone biosynthesis C-methylase UbiE